MAGLCAPLSTLRRCPRGHLRMTRGRCGSLLLHRDGLAPSTPCRSSRRTPLYPRKRTQVGHRAMSEKCQQRKSLPVLCRGCNEAKAEERPMKLHTLVLLSAMAPGGAVLAANADAIYFGGPILTVNDKVPRAEAVAVRDGKIVAVGKKAIVMKAEKGNATKVHDLK